MDAFAGRGWAIFLTIIFPTMGVIGFSNVIASDKYAYLPVVGLLMILAYWMDRLWRGLAAPAKDRRPEARAPRRAAETGTSAEVSAPAWRRVLIVVVAAAVALGEAGLTRRYLSRWQDSITLYRYMLTYAPEDP